MTKRILLISTIFALTNCNSNVQQTANISNDSSKVLGVNITKTENEKFEKTEILCDTVYKDKGYKLTLNLFDTSNEDETIPNTIFTLSKLTNGQYLPIYADSVFNKVQEIHFADFNNDKLKTF